jgi:ABC-type uncharacterized transport system fused permease/ATPase subunit
MNQGEILRPADLDLTRADLACFDIDPIAGLIAGNSPEARADWASELSPGELQRLALARALLRRPALVVMDEPTAAVGGAEAGRLLGLLQDAGVTCVTVGPEEDGGLRAMHGSVLRLGLGGGAWNLESF